MSTVIVTGGTGLVGRRLTRLLVEKGWEVIVLTRRIPKEIAPSGVRYAVWDVTAQTIDTSVFSAATAIIHLAGAGVVDRRWTASYKKEIAESRTRSSALLINTLQHHQHRVKTFVSASAIGWYGPDRTGQIPFTEEASAYTDFLGTTCQQWEASVNPVAELGIRVVKLRTGIVLSKEGGALKEFIKPLRLGVAAILGTGDQIISWIHIDDLCRMFIAALEKSEFTGAYNAVAPQPVTNRTLNLVLAKYKRGRFFIPLNVPAWVLKIIMGESSVEVLKSCTVSSEKVHQAGFAFLYPAIEPALKQLCTK